MRNIINVRSLIVRAHLIPNFKEGCPLTSRALVRGGFRILGLFNASPNSICDMSRAKRAEKSSRTPKELANTEKSFNFSQKSHLMWSTFRQPHCVAGESKRSRIAKIRATSTGTGICL